MLRRLLLFSWGIALAACSSAPPADPGPATAVSFDGASIAYDVRGQGGPTLVFVHGWAETRREWDAVREALAPRYRTVALDLAGHGASGGQRARWRAWDQAHDVAAVVRDLDLRRVVLVGHAQGGPVACLAAGELGARVLLVVGVDAFGDVETRPDPIDLESWAVAVETQPEQAFGDWARQSLGPDADAGLAETLAATARSIPLAVSAGLLRARADFRPDLALEGSPAPVVLVNPERAAPPDLEAAERHAPGLELWTLEDAGPFPMLSAPRPLAALLDRLVGIRCADDRTGAAAAPQARRRYSSSPSFSSLGAITARQ